MAAGINLPFFADVRNFLKGTDSIADALDDVAGSLDEIDEASKASAEKAGDAIAAGFEDGAKDASRAADKLERDVSDNMTGIASDAKKAGNKAGDAIVEGLKDAGTASDKLEKKVSDSFRGIAADAKAAGDKVGKSMKDGSDRAGEGLDDMKSEAASTAKETAASFDGSADSIVGSFQEVAANAFAAFGPAGLAAGLAAAAGIGVAMTVLQGVADEANDTGEAVTDMATKIREAGGDMSKVDLTEGMIDYGFAIQDTKEWFEFFQDSAENGFEQIKKKSEEAGVSWVSAFKGTKGSAEDSRTALADVVEKLEAAREGATMWVDAASGMQGIDLADQKKIDALEDLKKKFETNIETVERAESANRDLAAAGIKTTEQIEAEKEAVDAANESLLAHRDALDAAAGAAIDADKAELDYVKTLADGNADIKKNGETVDINTEKGRANRQTLLDMAGAANSLISAQIEQGDSTAAVTAKTQQARDSFIRSAQAAGYSKDEAKKLADQYGLIPKNVATKVEARNVEKTRREIDGVAAPRDVPINLTRGTESVSSWLRGLSGRTIPVNIAVRGGRGVTD